MKLLKVRVIPNSKINKIIEQGADFMKIKLNAPALEGKANMALIKFLSSNFQIPKSQIKILSGEKSREKRVSINLPD